MTVVIICDGHVWMSSTCYNITFSFNSLHRLLVTCTLYKYTNTMVIKGQVVRLGLVLGSVLDELASKISRHCYSSKICQFRVDHVTSLF